jgi:roadblock/LC7 domain-containing protein
VADGNSLINLGDISKPATVLIEKVCAAVGVVFEPHRVKRMARAEAEAEKIKALSRIELSDIEHRAIERLVAQEARKQENIEQITAQAAASLPLDADVQALDEDWVAHFFKQCDTVSDKEMQSLWSRLLSGEATKPGTYAKRTVDFVSTMDKSEAELFTKLCTFVWMIGKPTALVMDISHQIYVNSGITFNALKHLDSIGLISFESLSGYERQGLGKYATLFYYGRATHLEFEADQNNLAIGKVLLTNIGIELVSLSGSKSSPEFYNYIISDWSAKNIILSSHVDCA